MTPTPTDLKNAKEFLDKNLPELKKHNYIVVDIENPKNGYCISPSCKTLAVSVANRKTDRQTNK